MAGDVCLTREGLPHKIRAYNAEWDRNFVLSSWLRSYRRQRPEEPESFYFGLREPRIKQIISQPGNVLVACAPDDLVQILGWVAFDATVDTLHYLFVKKEFRGAGLGRALFLATQLPLGVACSHRVKRMPQHFHYIGVP